MRLWCAAFYNVTSCLSQREQKDSVVLVDAEQERGGGRVTLVLAGAGED